MNFEDAVPTNPSLAKRAHVRAVVSFVRHCGASPRDLGTDDVRGYLLHLRRNRGFALTTVNVHLAALRFLYSVTLHRPGVTSSFRQIRVDRLEAGEDIRSVQILLGHVRITSTARYTHLTEARRARIRSPLDVFGPPPTPGDPAG